MSAAPEYPTPDTRRHDIQLRDVRDGRLVVSYLHIADGRSLTAIREVSTRLPFECLTVFDGGTVDVDALTPEERAWLKAESAPNTIDFNGGRFL